jgi:hypothetical protein
MATKKRRHAKRPREHFLYTNLTAEEYKQISEYCRQKHISISQFFADLLIEDARKSKGAAQKKLTLEIELTPEEQEKLEQLTRLHKKQSVSDFVREVLGPELQMQRLHAATKTKHVRYYFSDDEYQKVTTHMKDLGKSPSNYPATLALRAIRKSSKQQDK